MKEIEKIKTIEDEMLIENDYRMNESIYCFWNILFSNIKINRLILLNMCLSNNVCKNMPESIIRLCIEECGYYETKKIIEENSFDTKYYWLLTCYSIIPDTLINEKNRMELLKFFSRKIVIKRGHYINLNFLDKYISIDEDIYINVYKILYDTYKDSKFEFSLYTNLIFNKYSDNTPEKLMRVFKNNYELLMDIYLLLCENDELEDYDGTYFNFLINVDLEKFMNKYFSKIKKGHSYRDNNILKHIWKETKKSIESIINKILELEDKSLQLVLLKDVFVNQKEIIEVQDEYLKKIIVENQENKELINHIFEIISERTKDSRIACINQFLIINSNFEDFKTLKLESMFFSWSGSQVPIIEKRIQYYLELNDNIKKLGIQYLKHRTHIENIICALEERKTYIIKREFIDEW